MIFFICRFSAFVWFSDFFSSGSFGASWAVFGGALERLGGVFRRSWGVLAASWRRLGITWRRLGAPCRFSTDLKPSWSRRGGVLEASFESFGMSLEVS